MKLHVGEVRQLGVEIFNKLGQIFEIEVADYEIINRHGEQIEAGEPIILTNQLLVLFSATEKGLFHLVFKYHIGPEILKARLIVEVV